MAEDSALWTTGGAGDGAATITRADWSDIMKVLAACMDDEGVAPAYLNALVPSTTGANNARIGTGGAVVDGKPYWNNANVDVTIPSASGGGNTRIDRVVLRADWTAQTVRITRIAGTDAASPTAPAITQTSGSVYDIKLCQALVNTGGTVTITDERTFATPGNNTVGYAGLVRSAVGMGIIGRTANNAGNFGEIATTTDGEVMRAYGGGTAIGWGTVATAGIADLAVSAAKIAADSVDDTKVGNRVPALTVRQGGDPTDWNVSGTTTYTPTTVRMQCGSATTDVNGDVTVTFPTAFSAKPVVFVTGFAGGVGGWSTSAVGTTATQVLLRSSTTSGVLQWLAIGPE